ncbi:cysteine desulfurase family protein [Denitrobaculum tricleocarpae]|uniref:Cysteine desulfurase n=1 Tax=Denitrobaculum tricleocarpae TaxID=2591009 RepID=A0A545TAV8_9PROT|nr:cysteine desulfurase family protein [Denitrobaculum tricleocarpae]TQV74324.1 cysteine desulfurase [Denitrobaculum tricleocarpae]
MQKHYMDFNATAPIRPEVVEAFVRASQTVGNPSSVHGFGRGARRLVEEARRSVAALTGGRSQDVIFTSGGTEANNLALKGSGRPHVLVSAGEHDSVLQAEPAAQTIPLNPDGTLDMAQFECLLSSLPETAANSILVSVMLANNETGVIQNIPEIAATARRYGALVHCDAVQAAGKIPLDIAMLGVDMLSLSAHKIGGPQGIGALVLTPGLELKPLLLGGGQERRRRAGTENVAGCAGFGVAADFAVSHLTDTQRLADWRDEIEIRLTSLSRESKVFGSAAQRLPNTSCISMPGVPAETQLMALDLAGVAVSSGSACSSGKVQPSHVLRAMGASDAEAASALRISLGWSSTLGDVEAFVDAWSALYRRQEGREASLDLATGSIA